MAIAVPSFLSLPGHMCEATSAMVTDEDAELRNRIYQYAHEYKYHYIPDHKPRFEVWVDYLLRWMTFSMLLSSQSYDVV